MDEKQNNICFCFYRLKLLKRKNKFIYIYIYIYYFFVFLISDTRDCISSGCCSQLTKSLLNVWKRWFELADILWQNKNTSYYYNHITNISKEYLTNTGEKKSVREKKRERKEERKEKKHRVCYLVCSTTRACFIVTTSAIAMSTPTMNHNSHMHQQEQQQQQTNEIQHAHLNSASSPHATLTRSDSTSTVILEEEEEIRTCRRNGPTTHPPSLLAKLSAQLASLLKTSGLFNKG